MRVVFDAGVRKGWCVNEVVTIIETKDSVVYKDSIIERIDSVPCKDFDTTIGRARIKVSSGVLTYTAKDSVVYRTQKVKETVRDRKLEDLLRQDIAKLTKEKEELQKKLDETSKRLTEAIRGKRSITIKLSLAILLLLLLLFRKPLSRLIFI